MTEEKLNIRTRALAFMMLSLIVLFIIAPITVVLIMPESGSILLNYIMVNGPFIILFLFLFLLSEPIMHRPLKKIMEMEKEVYQIRTMSFKGEDKAVLVFKKGLKGSLL